MLSILIPTYNYNTLAFVKSLNKQALANTIIYEILVFDDGSPTIIEDNKLINTFDNCTYTILDQNIGRSAIRNLLAKKSKYDTLLFLDADLEIIHPNFIKNYINALTLKTGIIYGGICYQKNKPNKDNRLRWLYGKKREALSLNKRHQKPYLRFLTLNFIIKKDVFNTLKFNEDIPNLRHEDTLFAIEAKDEGININHIDNTVMHLGIEPNIEFLKKSIESVDNLHLFIEQGLLHTNDVLLSKKASEFKLNGLSFLVIWFYILFKNSIKNNLLSKHPSLFLFDLYRLGYYLKISSN